MVTISDRKIKLPHFIRSIRLRYFLTYLILLTIMLTVFNIYPINITKNFIFESKQTMLTRLCRQISSSMEEIENPTGESARLIIDLLETGEMENIIVIDKSGKELFRRKDDNLGMDSRYAWSVQRAKERNDAFYWKFENGVFMSICSMPIVYAGRINGVVTVIDADADQGSVIAALRGNILRISIVITLISLTLCIIFSRRLTSGVRKIVNGISKVREGEYNYRINVPGKDEITFLAGEFNSLTDRLQKTEEIRRQFVADASHELKTPLASIQLLSDSIVQNEIADMDTVTEFVSDIGNEARRLARTTDKLLRLTKLDNKIIAENRREDVASIAAFEVKMLRPLAEEKSVKLLTAMEEDCCVLAVRDDVAQIVINLVENAIKYNVEGGTVSVCVWKTTKKVYLSVEDTGIGIPEEEIENVFDRFYRVDKARSREAGGSGLGLSIVKSTADRYGWSIAAERRALGGMVFLTELTRYNGNNALA